MHILSIATGSSTNIFAATNQIVFIRRNLSTTKYNISVSTTNCTVYVPTNTAYSNDRLDYSSVMPGEATKYGSCAIVFLNGDASQSASITIT